MKGQNCALKLLKNRKYYLKRYKSPFKHKYHMARGTAIKFVEREAKQPNSALRKCVVVELAKTKQQVVAFIPLCGTRAKMKVHDEVLIQSIGGSKCRSKGDIAGVSYKVIKINKVCVKRMFMNKVDQ